MVRESYLQKKKIDFLTWSVESVEIFRLFMEILKGLGKAGRSQEI